jgi:hypothetical protein
MISRWNKVTNSRSLVVDILDMKLNTLKLTAAGTVLLIGVAALPAFAQVGLGTNILVTASGTAGHQTVGVTTTLRAAVTTKALDRANQEITRRIAALNALVTRINAMARVSADSKANLSSLIQTQIDALNTLHTQITSDANVNSTSSLKTDIQSITKSYRIFALVLPQIAIQAGADRVADVGQTLTTLAGQLHTRLADAQTAGHDVSLSVIMLSDMNAKIADANVQATAAANAVANLKPDNGDQTVMQANLKVMKDARAKIQVAQQDLVAARKDAGTIVKTLTSFKVSGSASSSAGGSL